MAQEQKDDLLFIKDDSRNALFKKNRFYSAIEGGTESPPCLAKYKMAPAQNTGFFLINFSVSRQFVYLCRSRV